jgi:hypothetical protein
MKAPVRWSNSDLEVNLTELPDAGETGFVLSDRLAGVELIFGGLEVRENVKLW